MRKSAKRSTHSSEEEPSTARSSTAQNRGSAELQHEEGHQGKSIPNRCRCKKKTNIIQSHYQWPDAKFKGTSRWRGKKNHKKKTPEIPKWSFSNNSNWLTAGCVGPWAGEMSKKKVSPEEGRGKKSQNLFLKEKHLHRVRKEVTQELLWIFESRWLAMAASDRKR